MKSNEYWLTVLARILRWITVIARYYLVQNEENTEKLQKAPYLAHLCTYVLPVDEEPLAKIFFSI